MKANVLLEVPSALKYMDILGTFIPATFNVDIVWFA